MDTSTRYQGRYSEIWYFAPEKVRKQVRRARAHLVSQGDLSKQEAERLFVRWYPLAYIGAETVQEDQEEDLDLVDIDKGRPSAK